MFPLLSSIHASVLYFNHRMVVLSSSPCYRFWLVPLHSLTQRRPLWNDGLSPSLPAAATSSLLCPYLTSQASSPVSLLLFPMWTERLDQSKSELQPAKKPQCLPLHLLPPSWLVPLHRFSNNSDVPNSLKPVKGPRIWNRKTELQAYARSPCAMWCWASLRFSWGEVVFLYTIGILVPTPKCNCGDKLY